MHICTDETMEFSQPVVVIEQRPPPTGYVEGYTNQPLFATIWFTITTFAMFRESGWVGEWDSNRLDATCDKSLLIIIITARESKSTPQPIYRRGGWELDEEIKNCSTPHSPSHKFIPLIFCPSNTPRNSLRILLSPWLNSGEGGDIIRCLSAFNSFVHSESCDQPSAQSHLSIVTNSVTDTLQGPTTTSVADVCRLALQNPCYNGQCGGQEVIRRVVRINWQ